MHQPLPLEHRQGLETLCHDEHLKEMHLRLRTSSNGLQLFAVGMLGAAATVMEALKGVAIAHILHLQVLNAFDMPLEPFRRPCDDITSAA